VLSISKLVAPGQAKYYLDQVERRVDAVQSIGDGVEEYYLGGTEARGQWMGAGARGLGLVGPVAGDHLRGVLEGFDKNGLALRDSAFPLRVAGYDLTYSAPKSVSVLFGLGDPTLQHAVREAHDRAVREAFGHIERTAAAVRRGHGGARVEPADGLIAAAFRHRTSRAGDPQLHTHVLVANLGRGPDGRWTALDGRRLYAQARTTSFIYQAVLRSELTRSLGVEWLTVRDGIAEVAGVPKPVTRAFSRRRVDIEAELARHGTSGARAAEAAALATRQAKDRRTDIATLTVSWRARAEELGFGLPELSRTLGRRRRGRVLAEADRERLFDALAAPTGLTRQQATFSRGGVIQALCERLPADHAIDAGSLEALADRFLASSRVVPLLPADQAREAHVAFRRRDGRVLPLAREEQSYSTPELLMLERRVMAAALHCDDAGAGQATHSAVRHAVAARPTLTTEQQAMVERLCLSGERITVVAGKAGTGKTYALAAAREAWQAAGHSVLGVAVARRAANQLQSDAGIATTTVAALLADVERSGGGLPRDVVLVVDEAGMLATRPLARLLDAVEQVGGKLVLVGDHRQLPELEAGGAFRGLVRRGLAVELTENCRQREAWERQALDQLREGRPEAAIPQYVAHERIHVADTPAQARQQLAQDWRSAPPHQDVVMIAQRRSDVADLNTRARTLLRASGDLTGPELPLPGGEFAAGDIVLIKRNELRLGVTNGERGRILAADRARNQLLVDFAGVAVTLDHAFLSTPTAHGDPSLLHGYAITCHVAQGLTVDRALVLADDSISNELAYTALSRGRTANHLYLARQPDDARAEYAPGTRGDIDPLDRLLAALKTSRASVLAIDSGKPDHERLLTQAQHELAQAGTERVALEARRWRPGRRAGLVAARERETAAQERVDQLVPVVAEQRHARRHSVDEQDTEQRLATQCDRILERRLDRGRAHGIER
jgi:conjugative relaxase-like TrwC/TraI family protein